MSAWRCLPLAVCLLACPPALAAPALFWLSLEDSGPLDPDVPAVTGVLGVPRRVHIWAQPKTAGSTTLQNLSLNVVSTSSGFSVDPNTVEVYNPTYTSGFPRFEYVSDSTAGLISVDAALPAGMKRGIANLQGFTIDTSMADGFGGSCDAADSYCAATSGADAWLLASFTLTPTSTGSTANLYLQVGLNGLGYDSEATTVSENRVTFGVDTKAPSPSLYNPNTDYDYTDPDDDPDAVLTLVLPGDYDADGDVDSNDYTEWRTLYGSTDSAADGNSDGVVDAADYAVWRNHYPTPAPVAPITPAPEPRTSLLCLILLAFQLARWSRQLLRVVSA